MSDPASTLRTTYDKAGTAYEAACRADLVLQAIECVLRDQADGLDGASSTTVDIIGELIETTRNMVKEASNVAGEVQYDLSGAGQNRRS